MQNDFFHLHINFSVVPDTRAKTSHNQPHVLVTLPDTVFMMPGELGERVQKQHVEQLGNSPAIDRPSIYIIIPK